MNVLHMKYVGDTRWYIYSILGSDWTSANYKVISQHKLIFLKRNGTFSVFMALVVFPLEKGIWKIYVRKIPPRGMQIPVGEDWGKLYNDRGPLP